MVHSYVHDNHGGDSVKSRAQRNDIHYNWIAGSSYFELDQRTYPRDWPDPVPRSAARGTSRAARTRHLVGTDPAGGPARELAPEQLEVAVLDRHRPRRTFRRITGPLLGRLLSSDDPTRDAPVGDETNGDDSVRDGSVRDATTNPQTQRTEPDGPPA